MLAERILPRARERLVTISGSAPSRTRPCSWSWPHTDLVVVCGQDGRMVGVLTKPTSSGRSPDASGAAARPG